MSQNLARLAIVVFFFAAVSGCAEKSPELQVAEARAEYTVKLTTFVPQQPEPVMEEPDPMEGEGEEAMAAATAAEEMDEEMDEEMMDEEMIEPEGPRLTDILFDLIVIFNGDDPLPGITVDITHADPFQKEKGTYRHYLETAGMRRGETKQVGFTLNVPDFETGDVFSVDLRSYVPPEEFGEYREFSAATGS